MNQEWRRRFASLPWMACGGLAKSALARPPRARLRLAAFWFVLAKGVVALGLGLLAGESATAATIFATPGRAKGDITVSLVGAIRRGDDARFAQALASFEAAGLRVIGIGLQGPGGETNTSLAIAKMVRDRRLPVFIWSTCASGCALIAIAAPVRVVTRGAAIAVHGAYRVGPNGVTSPAPDATAYVARRLRSYGIPERIVQKLERTPHHSISKLSRSDLAALGTMSPGRKALR
jgi:hypothetical protein